MVNFNINVAGFCIATLFIIVWAAALAYWKLGKVEEKWSSKAGPDLAPAAERASGSTA
jgi:high-affinity nickel-transport protein